jgi:tRNA G18 (ribose-2'-O)-methylase SpoU
MRKLKNEELVRPNFEQFQHMNKLSVVLVLDDIRSLHNVGSCFRTADAFAVEKIYLCGITGQPPHREIQKTALGATETVKWEYHKDILSLRDSLHQQGYIIVPVEQADRSTSLLDFEPLSHKKYALVFGNEVFGVKDEIVESAEMVLEIPQYGTKHSLNIAVSVGVVLWHYLAKKNRG